MFEQELELEKKQSAAIPLLLIVGCIIALVGVAAYYLAQSRKVLTTPEATTAVSEILKTQGPTTVTFHTGLVAKNFDDDPHDARYRLLEKAGVISISKDKGPKAKISVTAKGEEMLKAISGVKHTEDKDGDTYVVPLADRKLLSVSNIKMFGPERANVQYSWKWAPNAIGEYFDASGGKLSDFNTWDRMSLIDKYGARFYEEPPTTVTVAMAKTDKGWQLATE
jgi:predicted transcriptional regulator